ncbi:MAG TPA: class I SAM-dependent methyltransferase [Dehalococcoidia bacterium]|nr:class I SAM-dependent methyltransferase [Dehalococcoidia bacterium]
MDVTDIAWLRSTEGREATVRAHDLLSEMGELPAQQRLGESFGRPHARALVALVEGREVAASKFADAPALFCDRESAEQASGDVVARHTAARFASFARVADLGCSFGGDAFALAEHAEVVAIDRDPARLAMLDANAEQRGLSARITTVEADVEQWEQPAAGAADAPVEAVWLDPSRRDTRGRRFDPEQWSPPLSVALRIAAQYGAVGIKLAPGIDLDALPDGEVEFVSLDGRLMEAVLWLGSLAGVARRATVLPAGESLSGEPDDGSTTIADPTHFFYDPDPTVGRASLIDVLAARLGARKLSEQVAYLSADERLSTPFARRFRIHAWLPFSERRLYQQLMAMGAGRVEVMRRASPIDTNALERRLNEALSGGADVMTVALTTLREERVALILERERD